MPARCLLGLWLVLLFTSLLVALPPPLAAQAVRYEYDALGRLTGVSTPPSNTIGATEGPTRSNPTLAASLIVLLWLTSRAIPGREPSLGMASSTGRASRAPSDKGRR